MLPVLVIEPCTRDVPEENSEGTRPTNEPSVLPVNRVPVGDLHRQGEAGQRGDPAQALQAADEAQ
jgi:hypothetical protein